MVKRIKEIEVYFVARFESGVNSEEGAVCDEEEEGFVWLSLRVRVGGKRFSGRR